MTDSPAIIATQRAIESVKQDKLFFDNLKKNEMYPHEGQQMILRQIWQNGAKDVFAQCGRNFGKSTVGAIFAAYEAYKRPKSKIYVILPFRSLAKEVYWDSDYLTRAIPQDALIEGDKGKNIAELRLRFKNGSYIKLDGADNEATVRGYKPTHAVLDEFQDWKSEVFYGIEPNFAAKDATVLKIGTPPDYENIFIAQGAYIRKRMQEGSKKYFYVERPTETNPHISKEWLAEKRRQLYENGEAAVWEREFMARFVPGGARSVFPMLSRERHVRNIQWIEARNARDVHKLDYFTVLDPSATRFAVGFYAYNRYTAEAFMLDEILEKDPFLISAGQVGPKILMLEARHYHERRPAIRIIDEAAKLFASELSFHGVHTIPTQKRFNEKNDNISLVKDALLNGKFYIAEHCVHAFDDMTKYRRDEEGKIVKKQDDLVDTTLYFFAESGYTLASQRTTHEDAMMSDSSYQVNRRVEEALEVSDSYELSMEDFEDPFL